MTVLNGAVSKLLDGELGAEEMATGLFDRSLRDEALSTFL